MHKYIFFIMTFFFLQFFTFFSIIIFSLLKVLVLVIHIMLLDYTYICIFILHTLLQTDNFLSNILLDCIATYTFAWFEHLI